MAKKSNFKYFKERNNLTTKIDNLSEQEQKIVKEYLYFFVLNCPSGYSLTYPTSTMSKKFKEYGIEGGVKLKKLNKIKKMCDTNFFSFDANKDISNHAIDKFTQAVKLKKDYICVQEDKYGSLFDSIYYKLRNAFSHGAFYIKEEVFVLWNIHNDHLKGIFVLSKETMSKLIEIIVEDNLEGE
jgi:hypothetical protein